MTNRERMQAAIQANLAAGPKSAIAPPPSEPLKPKKPRPPKPPVPQVTHKCGHKTAIVYLEAHDCSACRNKARAEKARKKREEWETKRQAKSEGTSSDQRLPDGSVFDVKYDAQKVCWTGTLTLADGTVFSGTASGVFRLLRNLDALYRAHAAGDSS